MPTNMLTSHNTFCLPAKCRKIENTFFLTLLIANLNWVRIIRGTSCAYYS